MKRCCETYPSEKESVDALTIYLQCALAKERDESLKNEAGRDEKLKAVLEEEPKTGVPYAKRLAEFITANPDTFQARKAFSLIAAVENMLYKLTLS